ncbi:MAG: 30S ribosomal protein S6 [Ignavibacteria bacterium CG22_combo_CG10-13_8_21_14_all_37_15]|nr:30S ribosomal protein S6 [Ignavibacteria bacterium]PIP76617.1 MAG: 30S ribosomal protein S6 [Ignavibacteria bacterium CG22_combo_CG10-13_8_21_14_all_37_15]PIS43943.1 MAG: 30S ribosomal protein S6 [Ignavibacteria bacterium CG08_land_8_20_14_0_20_37_9]PIX93637.1 MAG: 30S ribosomal protein S6 [Ignavibacteria bacterium CG_4_10_14_3_um_filter_37_18]PJC60812.1 MAG: 30S ribosomal protein S6 [Ignavibacteria bacterium CG_4_9_14_0_2_um_filter_37_13]
MRRNNYESGVIINATLDDTQIDTIVAKFKELIASNGGDLKNTDLWGRKRLAYIIQKQKVGYYVFFRFEAPSEFILKLERMYKLDENILRFLTLKLDKYALGELEKQTANQALKAEPILETVIAETPEIPETPAAANGDVKEDDK